MAQTTSSLEPHSPTLVIAMFALSSKITAPRALTATKPAKSQRRGLVVKVRGARRLVSRALFIHSTRRAEFVRRARAIAVSASLTRAHGAKVSCRLAYLHETAAKGSRGDAGALDMFKISPARDTLGKIFSSAIRGLTDANDSRDNHRLVRPSTRPTAVR